MKIEKYLTKQHWVTVFFLFNINLFEYFSLEFENNDKT
jgi:hypothetical protein